MKIKDSYIHCKNRRALFLYSNFFVQLQAKVNNLPTNNIPQSYLLGMGKGNGFAHISNTPVPFAGDPSTQVSLSGTCSSEKQNKVQLFKL